MASSSTAICNLALTHLGVGKEIASLDENSQEASACNRVYNDALDEILSDYHWNFANKFRTVELIEEEPNDEWEYSYLYPNDCIKLRRVLSGVRNDYRGSRVPFKVASSDDSSTLIYTDMENAVIEYTYRHTDPQFYPPKFTMAFSYLIASYIAARVTGGDPFKLKAQMYQLYQQKASEAMEYNANQNQPDLEPDSEFTRARE